MISGGGKYWAKAGNGAPKATSASAGGKSNGVGFMVAFLVALFRVACRARIATSRSNAVSAIALRAPFYPIRRKSGISERSARIRLRELPRSFEIHRLHAATAAASAERCARLLSTTRSSLAIRIDRNPGTAPSMTPALSQRNGQAQ